MIAIMTFNDFLPLNFFQIHFNASKTKGKLQGQYAYKCISKVEELFTLQFTLFEGVIEF